MTSPASKKKEQTKQARAAAEYARIRKQAKRAYERRRLVNPHCLPKTELEAIAVFGHAEDFVPATKPQPTKAKQGSREKVEVLAERLADGKELWCDQDANGLIESGEHRDEAEDRNTGTVPPKTHGDVSRGGVWSS